jgi:hypothetical protein
VHQVGGEAQLKVHLLGVGVLQGEVLEDVVALGGWRVGGGGWVRVKGEVECVRVCVCVRACVRACVCKRARVRQPRPCAPVDDPVSTH